MTKSITPYILCIAFPMLAGCDAWPTRFTNHSHATITVQYWDRQEASISAPFSLDAGTSVLLERDMFIKKISEIDVTEDGKTYRMDDKALAAARKKCPDVCTLEYLPDGRLQFVADISLGPEDEALSKSAAP